MSNDKTCRLCTWSREKKIYKPVPSGFAAYRVDEYSRLLCVHCPQETDMTGRTEVCAFYRKENRA